MDQIIESLGFNWQVWLMQIVLFVVLLKVMDILFWRPVLAHLAARDQNIAAAHHESETLQRDMETLRADYLSRVGQVEADARARIQAAIKEAQAERERVLAEARAESDALLKQGIAQMEREKDDALEAMQGRIVGLAVNAAGKALGTAADVTALRRSIEDRLARSGGNGANPDRN